MDDLRLSGSLTPIAGLSGRLSGASSLSGKIGIPERITPAQYTGPTTVTPTQEQQVLHTQDFFLIENIVIEPIPNNYGLIEWNGAVLTVS